MMTLNNWLPRAAAILGLCAVISCASDRPEGAATGSAATGAAAATARWSEAKLPATRVEEVTEEIHGVAVTDPYRWLEDDESPETREWIAEQQAYTQAFLASVPGRDALEERLGELLRVDTLSVPVVRGGRYFYSRTESDSDLPVICMREGRDGEDVVLIDPHEFSDDHTVSVGLSAVSADGSVLAYTVREGGEDEVVIRLFDVASRKDLPDAFPKGRYWGISILPDASGLFYTIHGESGPRLLFHATGTNAVKDRVVFGEAYGPDKLMGASLTEDGRYLLITVGHGSARLRTEIHVARLDASGEVTAIDPLIGDIAARFQGRIGGDNLYLSTDWNAPNGRILLVDLKRPARNNWREIVPESDAVIRNIALAGGRIFARCLKNAVSGVKIYDAGGAPLGDVAFPALGNVSGVRGEWGSDEAYLTFQSFHIPRTVYGYDVRSGGTTVWSRSNAAVDSDRFEVRQEWYDSRDGTRVPLFIAHAKGIERDGSHPVLLSGYGGFNVSLLPRFNAFILAWIENGGIYAQPSLRGGGEFGSKWHHAGMLGNKQNVFDDFFAAAEWLISEGYTTSDRLAISGTSNGGLLVGAALTQRPELFRTVLCKYPLLDMIRYHMFLAAPFWVSEYGSADDAAQFAYLLEYSPYYRVVAGTNYPAVMLVTGDADTRVAPLHARKMAALLQAAAAPDRDRPVLLQYDTQSGHVGAAPVSKRIEKMADELLFLMETVKTK